MRAFVAVDVPPLPGSSAGGAPYHLTLRFFDDLREREAPLVIESLDRVAGAEPTFLLELAGVGAFPDERNPRVVWVGVTTGREPLLRLERRLGQELAVRNVPPDPRPFVPHVTLFRVRGPRDRERAVRTLGEPPGRSYGATSVTELLLKESELHPGGAVHRVVHRARLGLPSAGD